jgi:hypothetical protein
VQLHIDVSKNTSTIAERHTSILIAIIGFTAAVTPILVTSLSAWVSNMPVLDIDMIVYRNGDTVAAEITLTNFGFGPATNIILFVDAPGKISNINIKPGTANITATEIKESRFTAHIPKLVQGAGSFVKLDLFLARNQSISSDQSYYPAYVTYDQGSTMEKFFWDPDYLLTGFFNYINLALVTILVIPIGLFTIGYSVYFEYFRQRKERQRDFISGIIDNLTQIRRELTKNTKHQQPFLPFSNVWKKESYYSEHNYIKAKEIQDYIVLDDFYVELDERNQSLSSNISDYKLETLNKHLLYLANNALEKIDWKKYPR